MQQKSFTDRKGKMEHFHIIQALCRIGMVQSNDSFKQQVIRLRDALKKEGLKKEATELDSILRFSEKSVEMAPSKVKRSMATFSGEELTPSTPLPVNKETSIPLAEIRFIKDLPEAPPIFNDSVDCAIKAIIEEWRNLDKIASVNVDPIRSCLIYGEPGTGKTQLALWMARQLNLPVVLARLDGLMSSFLGTTSRNIGALFSFADRYRCLFLLDEFDAIAKFRADPQEVGEIKRVVNTLLQSLDARKNHGFTIGITNHDNLLDPAVWRRFDIQVKVPKPSRGVMEEIIRRHLPPVNLKDSQIHLLSWLLEGGTGADVEILTRWIKKTFAVSENFQHEFLRAIQQFIFLNGGRVASDKKDVLLSDRNSLRTNLGPLLRLNKSEVAELLGENKSTISRANAKKEK